MSFVFNAQQNLVPNPGFESYTICPNGSGQTSYLSDWYVPTTGTPDYYNACFDSAVGWTTVVDVPLNFIGYQNAKEGVGYIGVFAFDYTGSTGPTYREYIQAPLTNTLLANQKYYVNFYVSLADSSKYATSDIGAYFSNTQITRNDYAEFGYNPQIINTVGNILSNKTIWYKISGSFIALGGEKYITIGNFKNDSNTDTVKVNNYSGLNQDFTSAYYYVDNICVSTDSLTCNTVLGIKQFAGNQALFYFDAYNKKIIVKETGAFELQTINSFGKKIEYMKLYGNQNIDISDYESGCYIIIVTNQEGSFYKKIIINF